MIILLSGASHTGKTVLAQKLMEQLGFPYVSIDHIKMGLIRSGYTDLTPSDDGKLTEYLWPILREMIKTAIENNQNMILEGCYIPFDWAKDFQPDYLKHIRACWLVMSEEYIRNHFSRIMSHACDIEQRLDDSGCTAEALLDDNRQILLQCRAHGCSCCLITDTYDHRELIRYICDLIETEV